MIFIIDDLDDISACSLLPDTGPCRDSRALKEMWYFDRSAGLCKTFNFGGCHGNKNRFHTRQECMDHCLPGMWIKLIITLFFYSDDDSV